jgi:hypothetical protein
MDSITAVAVTSVSSANVSGALIRCQRTCAAKKVENRMAMPAASRAFAVTA